MAFSTDTIYTVLRKIQDGDEYVLPAIQREFIWAERTEERIYNLLDSIVRKYPFGSMLFWESKPEKYRKFDEHYLSDESNFPSMLENTTEERKILVLDGQQRLQSLYLAMFGTFNRRQLFFDVFSNPKREVSERRFEFEFLSEEEVLERNSSIRNFTFKEIDSYDFFVPFQRIIYTSSPATVRRNVVQSLKEQIENWDDKIEDLVDDNINKVIVAFKSEPNLHYFEVSDADIEELNMDDIMEIFVRINSGGMQLEKSDLMFSILALKMKRDPWEVFGRLLQDLHASFSDFKFEKDYFIKCFLVINGLGARYEIKKLRPTKHIRQLEEKIDRIGESIKCCMDFVINNAKIMCEGILGSYNALIPLIYWLFNQKGTPEIPQSEYEKIKYFLYMCLFTRATTRYADSRIDSLLKRWGNVDCFFPMEDSLSFIKEAEREPTITEDLLNLNVDLTLNILQDGVRLEPGFHRNKPERDHIFPRSLLSGRFPENQISHFANFWFIPMGMNRNKTNKPPRQYFKKAFDCDGEDLKRRLEREKVLPRNGELELLNLSNYEEFLIRRSQMIIRRTKGFLKY